MFCGEQVFGDVIFALLELPDVAENSSQPKYEGSSAPGQKTLPRVGGKSLSPNGFNGIGPDWPYAIAMNDSPQKDDSGANR